MASALTVTLTFESDNPYNTVLFKQAGTPAYSLATDYSGKKPVSRVLDGKEKLVAEWTWRDIRSDLLTFRGPEPVSASSWLKKKYGGTTFKDEEGQEYTWRPGATNRTSELYLQGSDEELVARFERSFRDFQTDPDTPTIVPAQLLLSPQVEAIQDMVIVSFFLLERHSRQGDRKVLFSTEAMQFIGMSSAVA